MKIYNIIFILLFLYLCIKIIFPKLYLYYKIKYLYFKNLPYNTNKILNDNIIFVSIASYRDPQLVHTVNSLFDMCSDPSLVHVVVCEQNDITDTFTLNDKRVQKIIMDSKLARGPCWARYLIQQEWKGEEYYLQIDSHTRFVKDWDKLLRTEIKSLGKKSCLSNYVSTYDIVTGKCINKPLRGPMRIVGKGKDGFYRFNSKYVDHLYEPTKSFGWSGCFSFSSSQLILDAPYDPKTPFLFFGEETDIFLRLNKKGWEFYVPSIPICFTSFDRSYRKTFWEHPDNKAVGPLSRKRIKKRMNKLLIMLKQRDHRF